MKLVQLAILFLITHHACLSQQKALDYFGLNRPAKTAEEFNPPVLELDETFVFNAI